MQRTPEFLPFLLELSSSQRMKNPTNVSPFVLLACKVKLETALVLSFKKFSVLAKRQ